MVTRVRQAFMCPYLYTNKCWREGIYTYITAADRNRPYGRFFMYMYSIFFGCFVQINMKTVRKRLFYMKCSICNTTRASLWLLMPDSFYMGGLFFLLQYTCLFPNAIRSLSTQRGSYENASGPVSVSMVTFWISVFFSEATRLIWTQTWQKLSSDNSF